MEKAIHKLELAGAIASGGCMIIMMLVISADAFMRYLFHAPLQWAFDLVTSYLMVAAAYLAISETFRRGDHISITLVQSYMPKPLRAVLGAIVSLLALIVFAMIAIGAWNNAAEAFRDSEYLPGYFSWPLWPSHLLIALGAAILVLRLLHHAVTLLRRGEDPSVHAEGEHAE